MSKQKTYLPFPLFLIIFLLVGYGVWSTIANLTLPAQPVAIDVIAGTKISANLCQDKPNGTACEYEYCPPCTTGNQCSQQEITCYPLQGNCQNNFCLKVDSEPELTYEQYLQMQAKSPSPSISPSPSPSPSASAQVTIYLDGDLNQDKSVDIYDYNLLITEFGTTYSEIDYTNLLTNFGKISL